MSSTEQGFNLTNPHALASIVKASETKKIVASQDIFDERGNKLWGRNQPITASLHERLLARKLRQPLEACLRAEEGVTNAHLRESLKAFLDGPHALAAVAKPWAARLLEEVQHLPLHAAVQLLLTTSQATQPKVFDHAIRGMALAGAMQLSVKPDRYDLRLAMLGGLLHDVGEMYVNPDYLSGHQLDLKGYRHIVTHPRIGEMLLATTTDYPAVLARAVGEHHERLDGTGYPMRRLGPALSPLGRLLGAVEVALGMSNSPSAPLTRCSFAMRMVPGELDAAWVDVMAAAASNANEDVAAALRDQPADLMDQIGVLASRLQAFDEQARALQEAAGVSDLVKDVAMQVMNRIARLRIGGDSIGMWSTSHAEGSAHSLFELSLMRDEMNYRVKCMARDCLWVHKDVNEEDAAQLSHLWALMAGEQRAAA